MSKNNSNSAMDVVLVFLSGQVSAQGLKAKGILESLSKTALDREVILDLRGVARIERSAVIALTELSRQLIAAGGRLFLSGEAGHVRSMMQASDMEVPAPLLDETLLIGRITGGTQSRG